MDNYLKINKKPGWVAPLLLKAYVNFFRFSNFDFGSLLRYRSSNHLSSTKRPEITPI